MQHIHIVNQRRISTQGPNIRGILQCSTSTLPINVVVQHKLQMKEVFCNTAHMQKQMREVVQDKRQI